jgi:hypothetical protein
MDMKYTIYISIKVETVDIPPVLQNSKHTKCENGKPVPNTCHEGIQKEWSYSKSQHYIPVVSLPPCLVNPKQKSSQYPLTRRPVGPWSQSGYCAERNIFGPMRNETPDCPAQLWTQIQ